MKKSCLDTEKQPPYYEELKRSENLLVIFWYLYHSLQSSNATKGDRGIQLVITIATISLIPTGVNNTINDMKNVSIPG